MLHITHSRKAASPAAASLLASLRKVLTLVVVLASLGVSQQALAQTFYDDAITLVQQPSGSSSSTVNYAGKRTDAPYNTYTRLGNSNASPVVAAPNVGTYDLNNTSSLKLDGASIIVSPAGRGTTYTGARLMYRAYLTNTTPVPNYSQTMLAAAGTDSFGDPIYSASGDNIDVLNGLTSGGNYTLEVQFVVDVSDGSTITPAIDPSGANGYTVVFYVTPPPTTPAGGTTTWQSTTSSGGSTDWTLPANWSNGVPTRFSNAIIPPKANSTIVYPVLNSPTTLYEVNNLTLQGNQSSSAAQVTINTATLRVYGNISQVSGGLTGNTTNNPGVTDPINNSTLILAGADQVITGNLLVSDIIVSGSGTKSVINQLTATNVLAFQPTNVTNGVILQSAAQDVSSGQVNTVFDTTGNSYIQLVSSSTISTVAGQAETNTSYIKGVTRADRQLVAGVQNTFGNIGIDITANHTPGNIVVYRVVGDALTGPLNATAVPIKRQYKLVGDDNSGNTSFANSQIDLVFHYLNSADELNGIQEDNLTMFRTVTNGAPYQAVLGTLNKANRTVTRPGLNSLPNVTYTLGDRTNPLPVSLVAFAATRTGNNAQLNWTTATESNNKGFNVQVSTDGKNFSTLDFVASKLVNSTQKLDYTYLDQQGHKSGIRYYRLEQVDQDGKTSYSPVRAVSFAGGAATELALLAYPNPFSESLTLTMDGATVGEGTALVRVTDLSGRVVLDQRLTLTGTSLTLGNLGNLQGGIYLAKVTMPGGDTKTVRIRKQ